MTAPALSSEEQANLRETIESPVLFSNKIMQVDTWRKQNEILEDIASKPGARVSVKACHSSGKTFNAALLVIWWVSRFEDAIAVTTAPTWIQVEKLLWGDIHKVISGGRIAFPNSPNKTEIYISPSNYALGISTNEAERFQGFHEGHVLIVLDEATGVKTPIWEGIEGIRAGGDVRVLAIGNPTIGSGPFYDSHTVERKYWINHTISAFETPNIINLFPQEIQDDPRLLAEKTDEELMQPLLHLTRNPDAPDEFMALETCPNPELDNNVRPYLTTRKWVLEKWDVWGKKHNPLWDARVMGRFPKESKEALFPLSIVEPAIQRPTESLLRTLDDRVWVGIDVAGPGEDETVMYIVQGPNIREMHAFSEPDARGPCLAALRKWKPYNPLCKIDRLGLGHYFVLHMRDNGYEVVGINAQDTEHVDTDMFKDRKAEYYWSLRERCETGLLNGLEDEGTVTQLTSLKYELTSGGQVTIPSKKRMKAKWGVASPDRAEALMLAYAPVSPEEEAEMV